MVLLVPFAATLSATVLLPADFREIVAGSQIIVHGRVSEVRSEWIDGRRRIESVVTLEVSSVYRGAHASTVTFRVPGGQVGRYRNVMVGAPEFHPGEEVVLFLRANGPAMPRVFGLNQGVFRVRVDEPSGTRVVATPVVMSRSDRPERVTRGTGDRRSMALEQFAATIHSVLAQGGAR